MWMFSVYITFFSVPHLVIATAWSAVSEGRPSPSPLPPPPPSTSGCSATPLSAPFSTSKLNFLTLSPTRIPIPMRWTVSPVAVAAAAVVVAAAAADAVAEVDTCTLDEPVCD